MRRRNEKSTAARPEISCGKLRASADCKKGGQLSNFKNPRNLFGPQKGEGEAPFRPNAEESLKGTEMNGVIALADKDFVNERVTAGARAKTSKLESDLAVPQDAVMVAVKLHQQRTVQLEVKIRRSVVRRARAIPQIAAVKQKGHMGHTK
ncbi:hypothetical protein B0H14DRAFT_2630491 [Mycena olivaceomarginata]|nr:hypothetical protein B0H14DRAFT_2630491 [Mycena olivaceomarginata]